ncbi:126_t:CDS:2 [Acaulospora morrowiae]|uniref:126_t:CDS:1 n=1 Tax=Acaulospora morrowiae TaxID=94023 RepID=A0A9N9BME7_9GLOM|nr:126_t:CDS:2 [Acaulospora morrowiae]
MSYLPPEILENIFHHTNISTLHSCILVNRAWCRVAIYILWSQPFKHAWKFKEKDTYKILTKSTKLLLCYSRFFHSSERSALGAWYIDFPSSNVDVTPLFEYPYFLRKLNYVTFIFSIERLIKHNLSAFLTKKYKEKWRELEFPVSTYLNSKFFNPDTRSQMKSKSSTFFNNKDGTKIHSTRKNKYRRMVKVQTAMLGQYFLRLFIRKGSVLTKLKLVCPEDYIEDWQQTCKYAALMDSTDILMYLGTIKKLEVGDLAHNLKQSKLLGELAITCNNLKRLGVTFYRTTARKKHIPDKDLASLILSQNSLLHFRYRGIAEKLAMYSLTTQIMFLKRIEFEDADFRGDNSIFYWIAQCEVLECLTFGLRRYVDRDMLAPLFKNNVLPKLKEVKLGRGARGRFYCDELEEWLWSRKFKKCSSYLKRENIGWVCIYRASGE